MQFKTIVNLLRKQNASASDLRQALAAIDVDDAERSADELEAARRRVLIEGDDRELAEVDERIVVANRQIERLVAARQELESRLAAAELAEAAAALDAERDAAEKEIAATAKVVRDRYPKLAGEMVELLSRLEAADELAETVTAKLRAAGRAERLDGAHARLWSETTSFNPSLRFWKLSGEITLPRFLDDWAPGWGDAPSPGVMKGAGK